MEVHIPTMFLVIIVVSSTLAAAIAFAAFGRDRSLLLWASALALHAVAYSLYSLRGHISDFSSIVLGNIALSSVFALFAEGIYRFQQRRSPKWLVWLPVAIVAVSFYGLLADLRARIIVGGLIFAAQSLMNLVVLMRKRQETVGRGQYILAAGAVIALVVFVFRSVATASGTVETLSITASNPMQADTFMMSIISLILLAFGLVMMTKEQAEAAERRSKLFTQGILDSVSNQIAVLDRAGVIVSVNEPWRQFSLKNSKEPGQPAARTAVGVNYLEVCGNGKAASPDEASDAQHGIRAVLDRRIPNFTLEYPCHSPTEQRWFTMTVTSLDSNEGGAVVVHTNISERKQAEEKLRLAANVFTHAYEGILLTSASGEIVDVNEAFSRITGYARDEVLGHNLRILKSGMHDEIFYAELWQRLVKEGHWQGELWNRRKNGEAYAEQLTLSAVHDEKGQVLQCVALFSDITERKHLEEQVHQLAFFDPLTNLPNRRLFKDRLNQRIAANKRSGLYSALMFLDLDNFKPLNDTQGHDVGDLLLIEAASRLKRCVRDADTVARFGGDEFVVLLSDLSAEKSESTTSAGIVAEKIRSLLSAPYVLSIQRAHTAGVRIEHRCTASIGVAVFIGNEASQDDILKWADEAMYRAKESGRNSVQLAVQTPQIVSGSAGFIRLTWHPAYACGNQVIDEQHRALFTQINNILAVMLSGQSADQIGLLIDTLIRDIVRHFKDEEDIMANAGFPGAAGHAAVHQGLGDQAAQMRAHFHQGNLSPGDLFQFLAQDVVAKHMLGADREFFAYLENQREPA